MYDGDIRRLIINMPPRCLKTYLIAKAFPAWVMGKKPHSKFIVASYGSTLAEKSSVACRDIVSHPWFADCFAGNVRIKADQNHKDDWATTQGGGYYAAGILGGITGHGADYFVLDDPLKPGDAFSDVIRPSTNNVIRDTAFSRFNDPRAGKFVLVMQRLHEDDPTANLMQDGGFHVLKLPAEAKGGPITIDLGAKKWLMADGDLLFPQRLTKEYLAEMSDILGDNYPGQYLQEPVPAGGGEIKTVWPNYYRGEISTRNMNIYILCDPAGGEELQKKKRKLSDRTAMMVVGLAADRNYYLLDIICDRLNPTERVNTLFDLVEKWAAKSGKQPKVGYERYSMQTDLHYINQTMDERNYRFPLIELGGGMNKNDRIRRMIPDLQTGRWWLPENKVITDKLGRSIDLVHELVHAEMGHFPRPKYDDMLDALSRLYDDEMNCFWPAVQKSKSVKAIDKARRGEAQSWVSF